MPLLYDVTMGNDTDWMKLGNCYNKPELVPVMFPTEREDIPAAKNVCAGCKAKAFCLEYSLEHDIRYGVWGGKSEGQRARYANSRHLRDALKASQQHTKRHVPLHLASESPSLNLSAASVPSIRSQPSWQWIDFHEPLVLDLAL